jgi:hypothetical protein
MAPSTTASGAKSSSQSTTHLLQLSSARGRIAERRSRWQSTADRERLLADTDVAQAASPARILVIATREDLTILRETRHVLAQRS